MKIYSQRNYVVFAVILGIASVVTALCVAYSGYRFSVDRIASAYQQFYLSKVQMLIKASESQLHSDKQKLQMIEKVWSADRAKPSDEYVCIVDNDSNLILHTKNPATLGNYVGNNLLPGDTSKATCQLKDLVKDRRMYIGDYISSAQEKQLAVFDVFPDSGWVIGIHRSREELKKQQYGGIRHFMVAMLVICGVLMPFSLMLMFIVSRKAVVSQEKVFEDLNQSEEKYKFLVEKLKDVVVRISMDGILEYCSPAVIKFGGYDPDEETGKHISKYFVKVGEGARAFMLLNKMKKHPEPISFEFLYRPKTKEPFYVEASVEPLLREGKVIACQCVLRDVSERKAAQEKTDSLNKALQKKMKDLQQFQKVTIGRESKMIELKNQVNELAKELGRPEPYR